MMRLRQIERAILPIVLAAITVVAPGILHAAAPRHEKHKPARKAHLHAVPPRHADYARTHRKLHHAVPSHRAKHRYHRSRYHRSRYHRRRYHRYRPYRYHPSADRIDQIQKALARAGFYQGSPSGTWDSQTVAAMKSFQQAHGTTPTGKIDATTLQQLGLGSDVAGLAPPRPLIAANDSRSSE